MRGAQTVHKVSIGQWVPAAGVITALLVASGVLRLVAHRSSILRCSQAGTACLTS
jgi:hypothetical protein